MTPEEIVAILNEHRHDGEIDWQHVAMQEGECYYSNDLRLKGGYAYALSSTSALIIATHYHELQVLQESDK